MHIYVLFLTTYFFFLRNSSPTVEGDTHLFLSGLQEWKRIKNADIRNSKENLWVQIIQMAFIFELKKYVLLAL